MRVAAIAFVAANLLHVIDHQRQGFDRLTTEVVVGGSVLTLLALVTLMLVLRRHSRAALACAVVGLGSAIAISASHLAPHWSALSDPYRDLSLDALSWAVMLAEVVAAAILGLVGVRALHCRRAARHGGAAA